MLSCSFKNSQHWEHGVFEVHDRAARSSIAEISNAPVLYPYHHPPETQ